VVRLDKFMTEEEFREMERRMAINRGEVYYSSETGWTKEGMAEQSRRADLEKQHGIEWPEHMIEAECTRLLEQDGWRALRTDPVSDRGRGKGFGEKGMADHLYIRYLYVESGHLSADLFFHHEPTFAEKHAVAQILWIEFKSADGKVRKNQGPWHEIERARGALTWIASVDFPASVAGFVEHYRKSGLNRGRV
jgi:hypothetical protein